MEYFIEGIAPLRYWYIKSNGQMLRVKCIKNFFDRALSSRKYSIFIYVLMEICFQWSKLLDPLHKIKNWDHSWTNWENPFQKGQTQKFLIKGPPIFWGAWMGNKIYISTYVQKSPSSSTQIELHDSQKIPNFKPNTFTCIYVL